MTGRADFTEEEWETVLEGPTSAGLIVSAAARGGLFRESFSLARAYTEARGRTGQSQLLDEIAQSNPKVDRAKVASAEELQDHYIGVIRRAVTLLEERASPDEVEEYRRFTIALAERVAAAKEEEGEPVSSAEREAIDQIAAAMSGSASDG